MFEFYASRETTEVIAFIFFALSFLWYISHQAGRLDRLHHRVESALSALDASIARRAGISAELSQSPDLDPVSQILLAQAAHDSLTASHAPHIHRVDCENALTECLTSSVVDLLDMQTGESHSPLDASTRAELIELAKSWEALRLSRRFYGDAARDCIRIRQQRIVRWFRLSGHAQAPKGFDFNDEIPPGLTALISG